MLKQIITVLAMLCIAVSASKANEVDLPEDQEEVLDTLAISRLLERFKLEKELHYETGEIDLGGLAKLKVPEGYKFLDAAQSKRVLTELWNNPPDETTMGMLFPEDITPLSDNFSYVIEISYSDEGHIKDDDVEDIDYADMLKQMQEDSKAQNKERIKAGYAPVEIIGWASTPYYDKENKKLYWAKELRFGDAETSTLNYNIRILGRKGYMMLNVIGDMDQLDEVNTKVNTILASVDFKEGNTYFDFDPSMDRVAAYGVGGLVAGKVLAKTGFFALLLKFWKFIAIGVVAAFGALKRFLFGGSKSDQGPNEPS